MQFIEMTGKTLLDVVNDGELTPDQLKAAGVQEQTLVRINRQGDIEVRRKKHWDVIGGLLGNFENRIHEATGLDWA